MTMARGYSYGASVSLCDTEPTSGLLQMKIWSYPEFGSGHGITMFKTRSPDKYVSCVTSGSSDEDPDGTGGGSRKGMTC